MDTQLWINIYKQIHTHTDPGRDLKIHETPQRERNGDYKRVNNLCIFIYDEKKASLSYFVPIFIYQAPSSKYSNKL